MESPVPPHCETGPLAEDRDRLYSYLSFALLLIVAAIVFSTFRHYGISWDERFQQEYGEAIVRYYSSLFRDRSWADMGDLMYYGGFFELISALATRLLPWGLYEARHLMIAVCGMIGIWASWKTVRLIAGPKAAFWTALFLVLYPSYYGHMFINSKDIPFAAFYIWSIYCLVRIGREFPRIAMRSTLMAGIILGITQAIRVGGMILLLYLYVYLAILFGHWLWKKRKLTDSEIPIAKVGIKAVLHLVLTTVIAYGVMLAFWPYAASKPFRHPLAALEYLSHIQPIASPVDYIPRFLFIKLPELVIVLLGIGILIGIRNLLNSEKPPGFSQSVPYFVLIGSVLIPIIYAMSTRPFLYDELRHFLFIGPPICCLAGITLAQLLVGRLRKPILIIIGVYLFAHASLLVSLHPYEYTYYNRFIGGIRGAYSRGYDTDYWVTSYREGVQELGLYLQRRDGAQFEHRIYNIFVGPAGWCAIYYFPANFRLVANPLKAQFCLSTTRGHTDASYAGRRILEVQRFQVPFVTVKARDQNDNEGAVDR